MPSIKDWKLNLTEDHILRAQGIDPAVVRQRRPAVLEIATRALNEGLQLLEPQLAYREYIPERVTHNAIHLNGRRLSGSLVTGELKNSRAVIVCVCTAGDHLGNYARSVFDTDPALYLALDALGSAAVEVLIAESCLFFENNHPAGKNVSRPIGPGMQDWTVQEGQPEIFSLVDAGSIGVSLGASMLMEPLKSASFVIGISDTPFQAGSVCDFCTLQDTCKYRGNHG